MANIADIFKALGDDTRIEIVRMLMGQSLCVCDIIDAFNLTQPAISHHLKILKQAGIIDDSKEGKWVFYSINAAAFQSITGFVNEYAQYKGRQEKRTPCSPNRL
ncbi:arsr-type transcription regulator hth motif [Lucifera butyrica]|uniref:Arsr-type transcription regulator hth motif n=1 Tax=Lucifera butyrica TaxID=1351585 RepID=A0A498RCQ3_9FIRM|nr:metalloregulator ArsR/SmtB family transcription factor [Lucifera butyrica]VBB08825.1 arsr-type transcription regulator hth motif [Lucifera butyrica]